MQSKDAPYPARAATSKRKPSCVEMESSDNEKAGLVFQSDSMHRSWNYFSGEKRQTTTRLKQGDQDAAKKYESQSSQTQMINEGNTCVHCVNIVNNSVLV